MMGNDTDQMTEAEARKIVTPHTPRSLYGGGGGLRVGYCCASVPDGGRSVTSHQCGNKIVNMYGELGYCRRHDPVREMRRREARDRAFEAEQKAKARARRIDAFRIEAGNVVTAIAKGHNDPVTLARDVFEAYVDVLGEPSDE